MIVSIIVAAAENGVIARQDGTLPWHQPTDVARFRSLTKEHAVIMGRKTYETMGRPLPDRQNIVISRDPDYIADGCDTATSIESALQKSTSEEVFIIGGGEIYKQGLLIADKIYLTRIHAKPEGTVTFEYDENKWEQVSSESYPADDKNEYSYSFIDLKKLS